VADGDFARLPVWQKFLLLLLGAAVVLVVWWFLFYAEELDQRESAQMALDKAQTELDRVETRKANFLEEQRKHEERERDLDDEMKVLPMSASTVDNLMQTFQQRARMVGMSVESWTNAAEEKQDFYARLPIRVKAIGTWAQAGEFFRRVSELEQIVSIENLSIKARAPDEAGGHPNLDLDFEAATYRFLSPEERTADSQAPGRKPKSRRSGQGGAR
jgi:type IV pilus assembly protein PilO